MRLFAALTLSAEAVDSLGRALGEGRDERLRWVPPDQWHITLAFYGEVDEPRVDKLREGLSRAAERTAPFGVRLATVGTFPRQAAKARVVWVGLDGEVDAMRRLADRCAGAGRRARIVLEDRSFRPHLTLGRARQGALDATDLLAPLTSYSGPWWTVDSVRLVHSTLGAQVRHETLAEWPLRPASA